MIALNKQFEIGFDDKGFTEKIASAISSFREVGKNFFSVKLLLSFIRNIRCLNHISYDTIRDLRIIIENHDTKCPDQHCVKCMSDIYGYVKSIRDNYFDIFNNISESRLLRFLKCDTENALSEWDDLAEDCAFICNPEFRTVVSRIMEKL